MQAEIDSLVGRFFAIFDNRAGNKPKFSALQSMFVPGAVICKREASATTVYSLDSFWQPRETILTDGSLVDFHEWEVSSETVIYGGIAARICRYKKAGVLKGGTYAGSGMKFLNFTATDLGWKITSILWEDDAEGAAAVSVRRHGADFGAGTS